jgi:predicted N-formylglutamate amidohydrolase
MPAFAPFDLGRLSADDPPSFRLINAEAGAGLLLLCDHASRAVPRHMNGLGLPEAELERHIAWDVGAGAVTELLAARFGCPAVLAGYSRLIIDCNRPLESPTLMPAISDHTLIPANQAISAAERAARIAIFFEPYHQAITGLIERRLAARLVPVVVAVHSFTAVLDGMARPWHIGLLFEHDRRLVAPLKDALLRLRPGLSIGENEPYAILGPSDYSIPVHAQGRGLPHIELEIRQDLIERSEGALAWSQLIGDALEHVLRNAQKLLGLNRRD